ncbi:hypothetical protein M408DRAFT_87028 [Serendipita vermifera MAFF 305830]|uniref:Uncharacterized protein n=1 Tax=Serendipita vermifera MAFF 305830 TaxID=933852 RepID=A0A0C3BR06_SERVB|nr:hypothetical protein M408DRAFT_87028 [Serendipita vermifera MAFF 305830]
MKNGESQIRYPSIDSSTSNRDRPQGLKRSRADPMEEFLTEMKRRRIDPNYDEEMAARLANLVASTGTDWRHPLHQSLGLSSLSSSSSMGSNVGGGQSTKPSATLHSESFPTQVSIDINSPEDLAAMNAFLLALGRDVTGLSRGHQQNAPVHPLLQPRRAHDHVPHENWFNDDGLAQIGLVGLPGLPPLLSMQEPDSVYARDLHGGRGLYPQHNRQSHSGNADLLNLYPGMDLGRYARDTSSDARGPALGASLRQTPPVASPLSTSSSAGSSHGGPANPQGSGNVHPSSPYDGAQYGGPSDSFGLYDTSSLKVSYDSLKAPSPPSLLLQQPALGAREGAGLLGTGPKSALFLQTSAKRMQQIEAQKRAAVVESPEASDNDELEEEDELDDDVSTPVDGRRSSEHSEEEEESDEDVDMVERRSRHASPERLQVPMEDSDSPDSDVGAHKPSHTLYPLLHREGDPALKLPALALPSRSRHVPSTESSSSVYPDLGSILNMDKARSPPSSQSSSTSASDVSTPQRRTSLPPITSVVVSPPSSTGTDLTPRIRRIGIHDSPREDGASSLPPTKGAAARVSNEERLRHAALIRALLVHINTEYVKKHGVPEQQRQSLAPLYNKIAQRSRTPIEDAMELDSPVEATAISAA